MRQQSAALTALAGRLTPDNAALAQDVDRARSATDEFAAWLESQSASKTGPSGVGVENYDWYLRNVMLLPYSWRDLVVLMERELARAHSALAIEEARNAALPPQAPVASADEHTRRFNAAVSEYMAFLRDRQIMTVHDDGQGFDPALPVPGHYGLVGMRERAAHAGGTLTLSSSPGEGTTVALHVPLADTSFGAS